MNEEELTEKLNTEKDIVEAFNNGFQKGKLEEREKVKEVIIKLRQSLHLVNSSGDRTLEMIYPDINLWISKKIDKFEEQLQKEIGGMK